ncbi:Dor1-domain-containing protein [Exidia glandulosa HHB12029]|uniref:Conserved oligomeric Golgi complex subunit 8 n=1 Tax=Exidia glandulosa HHB12029 TaxID=1314781 RepID=A0A165CRQ2_EXIGL|nr:Dor1-domain-containing protein [Exidia glandulosa HHB12029]
MDDTYIAQLAALPLQQIKDEPGALQQSALQLTQSLTALCHAQYPTFLLAHGSSSTLNSTLADLDSTLESLIASLSPLNDQCTQFAKSTQPVLAQRRAAALLLEHHDKLLDLLELPQLLTTCIVNSSYQEALDLIAHARQLATRFPDVAVVQDVRAEVEHAARVMAAQLLGVLREPAKLPVLFRAVNFLRRMAELDEDELALAFLTSRLALFDATVAALDKSGDDDVDFLRKYSDAFRECAYDVVSQYTTIFLEHAQPHVHVELHHLLASFVHTLSQRLVALVRTTFVPSDTARLLPPGNIATLLTRLSYTAQSLARLGLDLRPLFDAPSQQSIVLSARIALEAAADDFLRVLPNHLAAKVPAPSTSDDQRPLHVPPASLAAFLPLAQLTNALAGALNNLRLLAPPATRDDVYALFAQTLVRCGNVLGAADGPWARAALREYVRALVPFAERALLEGVYAEPATADAEAQGAPVPAVEREDVAELHRLMRQWESWIQEVS